MKYENGCENGGGSEIIMKTKRQSKKNDNGEAAMKSVINGMAKAEKRSINENGEMVAAALAWRKPAYLWQLSSIWQSAAARSNEMARRS